MRRKKFGKRSYVQHSSPVSTKWVLITISILIFVLILPLAFMMATGLTPPITPRSKIRFTLFEHDKTVTHLLFSKDSTKLFSGSCPDYYNNEFKLNINIIKENADPITIEGDEALLSAGCVDSLDLDPEGVNLLISSDCDYVYNLNSLQKQFKYCDNLPQRYLDWSPKDTSIIIKHNGYNLDYINLNSGKVINSFKCNGCDYFLDDYNFQAITFNHDSSTVTTGMRVKDVERKNIIIGDPKSTSFYPNSLVTFDTQSNAILKYFATYSDTAELENLLLDDEERYLIAVFDYGDIYIFDYNTTEQLINIQGLIGLYDNLETIIGSSFYYVNEEGTEIMKYSLANKRTNSILDVRKGFIGNYLKVTSLAVSPNNKYIAVGYEDGSIEVVDLTKVKKL